MANQVLTIKRKKYAVGLFWQPIGSGFVARNYARNLSRNIDKKLNLFTEYRAMVGIGARRMGHRPGMQSAAAEVVEALSEYSSFLAVFKMGDKYFLVAVRNGIILEDKLFDREDTARAEYFRLSEIPDWNALFAPGAWGMPRAVERSLADLVRGNSHSQLHSISRLPGGLFSVSVIFLFGLLVFYFFRVPLAQMATPRVQVSQIDPELAAEYKRQIDEKNKELDAAFDIEPKTPEPLRMPYEFLPDPVMRAQVCYQAIGFLMQPVVGWNQVAAECGEEYASAEIRRTFGTIGGFYDTAGEIMPAAFVQESGDDALFVRATLPAVETVSSQDERDAETVMRAVMTAFQSIDDAADIQIVTDALTNGVETVQLNIVEIAAQSKLTPMQFMKIFEDFGGVYMTRCQWNAGSRIWNYEVIIYAK